MQYYVNILDGLLVCVKKAARTIREMSGVFNRMRVSLILELVPF
jgi:hypothetical protein